jgi:cyclase
MTNGHLIASALTRREWLQRAGLISGGAIVAYAFHGQPGDPIAAMRAQLGAAPIATTELAPNLSMLAGPGGNVVVSRGADGKIVVDTFVQPAWTNLAAALDTLGKEKVTTVIDTHWHFDHADNNAAFRKIGAGIVAHDNTKKRMSEAHVLLGSKIPPSPADALPTLTFAATRRIDANGDSLMLGKIPNAHTDFIDGTTGGSINGMIDGVSFSMKQADNSTKIVPGHGPLGDLAALTRFRDMLVTSRDRVATLKKSGQTLQQVIAATPTKDLDEVWGKGFFPPNDYVALVYNTLP